MLCYGILCGDDSFISTNVQHVNKFLQIHPRCICRVFDNTTEAKEFLDFAFTNKPPKQTKISVPVKGRTIVYLTSTFSKEITKCTILLKRQNAKSDSLDPIEIHDSVNRRLDVEIEAITNLVDYIHDSIFTVYTSCQDLLVLYNRYIPAWETLHWIVENRPPQFEALRNLRNKIGNRTLLLKDIQKVDF